MTRAPTPSRIRNSAFVPAPWLKNRHAQTIFPALPWAWRGRPDVCRETLNLPDGDATVVDWVRTDDTVPRTAPLLVILHGLEGSAESPYARMLMEAASARQWRSCVLHFRDCGDYRNRLPRRYHAGETNDLRFFLNTLERRGLDGPILVAGYSLGGNVLLKYLGEDGKDSPVSAAAAVCVPLDLSLCAEALNRGFSKIYQRILLKNMKRAVARKFDRHTAAFDWQRAMRARTFAEFDDAVTAPLHGFQDKDDYYSRCSAAGYLGKIAAPTLIVNALDDPFMNPSIIPAADSLAPEVTVEIAERGGHVGFIDGGTPWRPRFYLPRRLLVFFDEALAKSPMSQIVGANEADADMSDAAMSAG